MNVQERVVLIKLAFHFISLQVGMNKTCLQNRNYLELNEKTWSSL